MVQHPSVLNSGPIHKGGFESKYVTITLVKTVSMGMTLSYYPQNPHEAPKGMETSDWLAPYFESCYSLSLITGKDNITDFLTCLHCWDNYILSNCDKILVIVIRRGSVKQHSLNRWWTHYCIIAPVTQEVRLGWDEQLTADPVIKQLIAGTSDRWSAVCSKVTSNVPVKASWLIASKWIDECRITTV